MEQMQDMLTASLNGRRNKKNASPLSLPVSYDTPVGKDGRAWRLQGVINA